MTPAKQTASLSSHNPPGVAQLPKKQALSRHISSWLYLLAPEGCSEPALMATPRPAEQTSLLSAAP